jgi:TP901 family phage tail tape measure protein
MLKKRQVIIRNADAAVKFFIDLSNKQAIKGINEVETKSEALAKKFNKAGKALTIGLTTPLVAFGTYAVKTATDFDKASNQMQASLGLTTQEAEKYDEVMRNIYNANYGESYEDVANSIATVQQTLDDLNPDQIETITESALTLRDTFEVEVNESIRATKALMDNFGISSDEAMNLITQGFQKGLNYSDEFIDNINEYSVQFGKLGLSAEDMFNIFQSGADAGAWNLDKIGDAVKEFSIRAIDGSNTTIDGFKRLGMNADEMADKFAAGGDVARSAFYEVIDAIAAMEDPVEQSIVGVDLFGTMWEDLGPEVVTQLGSIRNAYDQTNASMENMKNIKYDDLGSMLESLGRQFGDLALDVGNALMPVIQDVIGGIRSLVTWFQNLSPEAKNIIGKILEIAVVLGPALILISKLIGTVKSLGGTFSTVGKTISTVFGFLANNPIVLVIGAIVSLIAILINLWNNCEGFRNAVMGIINAIGGALSTAAEFIKSVFQTVVDFIGGIFNGLWNTIKTVVDTIVSAFSTAWNAIKNVATTVWNGIVGIFSAGGKIFTGLVDGIANVFKTIVNAIISGINKIIRIPFDIINGILNFIRNISILGVAPFKGLWKQNPLPVPQIPTLNVGTNYVAGEGLAYLHKGEAVVPKKYNPAVGGYGNNYQPNITIIADMDVNKFGKAFVRDIKTFSGGAKNSYNYGGGK